MTKNIELQLQFEIETEGTHAWGFLVENGFLVKEGSVIRKEIPYITADRAIQIRKELLAEGTLIQEGEQLRFTEDYPFNSPSGAAMTVLGRSSNGWNEWKTAAPASLNTNGPAMRT